MREDLEVPFSRRLNELRLKRGLSQVELARKAGLPASSISHFESGSRRPSLENLGRLAVALNASMDVLMGRPEPVPAGSAIRIQRKLDQLSDSQIELAESFIDLLATRRGTG